MKFKSTTIILFALLLSMTMFSSCKHCVTCMNTSPTNPSEAQDYCFDSDIELQQFVDDYEAVGYTCHDK